MKYNLDLFINNIEYVTEHNGEPEMFLDLKDGTRVEFTCYKHFIDAYIGDKLYKFTSISEFVDNIKINGKTLRDCWHNVVNIKDDLDEIDFTKMPSEQFEEITVQGKLSYYSFLMR